MYLYERLKRQFPRNNSVLNSLKSLCDDKNLDIVIFQIVIV